MNEKQNAWSAIMADNITECYDAVRIYSEAIENYRREHGNGGDLLGYLTEIFRAVYRDDLYDLIQMGEDAELCPETMDVLQDAINNVCWKKVAETVIDRIDEMNARGEIGE